MQVVSIEEISVVERRLTIVVPAEQVEEAYSKQINEVAKNANLKGFRPGKAPIAYIQQRFGESARQEALNEVMKKALYDAITEKKLTPVSMPEVAPKVMQPHQPLEFTVSFEVLPEIAPIQFTMDKLEKLIVTISDKDMDYVLTQLCKQHAKWEVVDRAAQEKDRLVIDYYAIFEGKSESGNKIQNFPLELGSHSMLAGFEEGLIGATSGEERTLKLTFPADFPTPEKANKPVEFVVQVKQIFSADIPELNESFIKQLGIQSGQLADLQTQIRQSLEGERDFLVKEKLKEQIFLRLLEQNPIEVPKSLVTREAHRVHNEMYPKDQPHNHQHSDKEVTAFNDVAKKRVTLGLLISEYAKQMKVKVNLDRVHQRIQEIATAYERPQEVITWLSSKDKRGEIEAQVLEDQLIEKLMEGLSVTEKTMSYAELKGIRL